MNTKKIIINQQNIDTHKCFTGYPSEIGDEMLFCMFVYTSKSIKEQDMTPYLFSCFINKKQLHLFKILQEDFFITVTFKNDILTNLYKNLNENYSWINLYNPMFKIQEGEPMRKDDWRSYVDDTLINNWDTLSFREKIIICHYAIQLNNIDNS